MKTLMLMRHAKSNWGDETLPDFERPLNERGERDAKRMGRELAARSAIPDHIICSPARRAADTVRLLKAAMNADVPTDSELLLYAAPAERIIEVVCLAPERAARLLVVGHNPGMNDAASLLSGGWLPEGMKTATIACIRFPVEGWDHVSERAGELEWVLYPRDLAGH